MKLFFVPTKIFFQVTAGLILLLGLTLSLHAAETKLKINEQDVIVLVLRQNLDVLATAYNPKIAKTLISEVQSRFDTLINGQARYNIDQSDQQSIVFGTDNRQVLYEASAAKKFPFGVQGRVYLSNQRDSTNSAFATDPAFFETRLGFEARAPFLKNRFGKSDRGEVSLAKKQSDVVEQNSLANLDVQVYRAVTTYWNLVAARQYLRVSYQFLKRAKGFLHTTQSKKIIGLSEDPDVLAAKALVGVREVEVLRAKNLIEDFQADLKTQVNYMKKGNVIPKDRLYTKPKIPTKQHVFKTALKNRNDYSALLEEAKAKDIQIAVAKDQKLPSIDLFTSLELNSVDPAYGKVLGQTVSAQNPNWVVGVDFSLSYENRLAKSALTRGKLEKAKLLINIKNLENTIALNTFEAWRELKLQRKETYKFSNITNLQKQRVAIEEKNYLHGRSSSDIIVRFQTDWLNAEKQRLDSELREKLADVDLRRIMSTLIPKELKKFPGETS